MDKKIWLLWAGIILCGILLPLSYYAQEKPRTETDAPKTLGVQEKIERLVGQLGADEAKVREKATYELKQIGRSALPALKEALKSEDPEVAWRARIIIRAIERAEESTESTKSREDTGKIWPKIQDFSHHFKIIIQGNKPYQSFSVTREPSGRITVTIIEKTADGKEETRAYSAESVEEFRKKYPEVAEQYVIEEPEVIEIPEIEIEDIWEKLGDSCFSTHIFTPFSIISSLSLGRRFEELRKEIEEMIERNRRLFDEDEFDRDLPREWFPEIQPFVSRTRKGELGVTVEFIEPLLREHLGLTDERGILVREVKEDSLGEEMGFQRGDIVLEVNGESIKTIWKFRRLLPGSGYSCPIRQTGMKEALEKGGVTVTIIRKGKKEVLKFSK